MAVYCPDCGDAAIAPPPLHFIKNAIRTKLENAGQTPAYNVGLVTNWQPVMRENSRLQNEFVFNDHPSSKDDFNSISDIGRGKPKESVGPIADKDISTFKAAIDKKITLFLFGHVDYCDIFNEAHSTAFCFIYVPNVGSNLPLCDRFNGEIKPRSDCPQQKWQQ
jgi:hypothetical protein